MLIESTLLERWVHQAIAQSDTVWETALIRH